MSEWWDSNAGRYRRSFVYKVFYVWGWRPLRWCLFKLPEEKAHHLGIYGLNIVGKFDDIWSKIVTVAAVVAIFFLRLLSFLPGCSWNVPNNKHSGTPDA